MCLILLPAPRAVSALLETCCECRAQLRPVLILKLFRTGLLECLIVFIFRNESSHLILTAIVYKEMWPQTSCWPYPLQPILSVIQQSAVVAGWGWFERQPPSTSGSSQQPGVAQTSFNSQHLLSQMVLSFTTARVDSPSAVTARCDSEAEKSTHVQVTWRVF